MFSIEYEGLEEVTKTLIEHCNNLNINVTVLHPSHGKIKLVLENDADLYYVNNCYMDLQCGYTLEDLDREYWESRLDEFHG
jgi:hypothetical protein